MRERVPVGEPHDDLPFRVARSCMLVSASWMIRYAESSTPSGSCARGRSVTSSRASSDPALAGAPH